MKLESARQEKNMVKSVAHHSQKCLGTFFAKWRTYSKLMVAKRQLRDLQAQKEKSKAKVQTFLKNIESFENERKDNSCLQELTDEISQVQKGVSQQNADITPDFSE